MESGRAHATRARDDAHLKPFSQWFRYGQRPRDHVVIVIGWHLERSLCQAREITRKVQFTVWSLILKNKKNENSKKKSTSDFCEAKIKSTSSRFRLVVISAPPPSKRRSILSVGRSRFRLCAIDDDDTGKHAPSSMMIRTSTLCNRLCSRNVYSLVRQH